jgi:hypothetical protein
VFSSVTNVKTTKPLHQNYGGDKENVSGNNNRAIMAITIVKKPPVGGSSKTSMMKNVLKKSMSVPNALQIQPKIPSSQAIAKKVVDPASIGQRQHEWAELMKKRKEQLAQKINAEKEKELNVKFTANPAPKFKKVPVAVKQPIVEKKKLVKHNSMPLFPLIMKHGLSKENIVPSCGDPERIKLMEERKKIALKKYQEPVVQFKAKPAAVLKKQPFQPVHNVPKTVESKPFKLHLADRGMMRSEFDKKLQETIALRRKMEEIRKRQADMEKQKIIRQKTEFRANPMPVRSLARNN